jgi:hypothetical protein
VLASQAGINADTVRRSKRAVVLAASPRPGQRACPDLRLRRHRCSGHGPPPVRRNVGPLREAGVQALPA